MIFEEKDKPRHEKKLFTVGFTLNKELISEMESICKSEGIKKSLFVRQAVKNLVEFYKIQKASDIPV